MPEIIRKLAKPVLEGTFRSVWSQVIVLPARLCGRFRNCIQEEQLNVQGKSGLSMIQNVVESKHKFCFQTVVESFGKRPKYFYDDKPDNGEASDLKVVLRNMEWRLLDAQEVYEKAKQKLQYKRNLEELYVTRCELMDNMNDAGGVECFEKFEQGLMNHIEALLRSELTSEDLDRFHGVLTGN